MARKIKVETDNSKWQAPKVRKKRKPMTEVQRVAATERLAAARDKKREENPEFGMSGIHESLRDLPKDHQLHPDKIKNWIKTQKDLLSSEKKGVRLNVKGAIARAADHDGYIRNMKSYLRNELKEYSSSMIDSSRNTLDDVFNFNEIDAVFNSHLNGDEDHSNLLWNIISFFAWHEEYF